MAHQNNTKPNEKGRGPFLDTAPPGKSPPPSPPPQPPLSSSRYADGSHRNVRRRAEAEKNLSRTSLPRYLQKFLSFLIFHSSTTPRYPFKDIRIPISTILSHLSGKKVEKILYVDETMSYDDVEIEDMEWNEELQAYTYPCPCGDLFQITKEDLKIGEEIARCPSCSLYITVIYNMEDFQDSRKKICPAKTQPVAVA